MIWGADHFGDFMTTRLRASRNAGRRLALMLALLLLPVGSLLYFFTMGALVDIRLGERQLVGVAYLQHVNSVYSDILSGNNPSQSSVALLANMPQALAAHRPSLVDDSEGLATQLEPGQIITAAQLWRLRNLVLDAATASDLGLGRFRDQQLLAAAVSTHLPELANLVKSVGVDGKQDTSSTEFSVLRSAAFLALSEAVKEDTSTATGVLLNEALSGFDMAADELDDSLGTKNPPNLTPSTVKLLAQINELSAKSFRLLGAKIESRTSQLRRQLALVLVAIGLASLFAIGFAIHMMTATFRQLDVVESAKEAVEASEAQAKALAEDLQKLNGEIANLNVDLSRNYRILKETQDDNIEKSNMAQLGALTAMVAHELRNPLGSVRTSSFTIDKLSRKAGLDIGKQTTRINHAVDRCDATISQLLSYAASKEVDPMEVVVSDWLESMLTEEANKLPAWSEIIFDNATAGLGATLDAKRLGQSIANLLTNSAQAYASQFKNNTIPTCRIDVSAFCSEFDLNIVVSDNGPGIPADKLSLVKEPLFTTKSFGPGLGLAIADQVARLHNGTLTIQSGEGNGTTVTIALPLNVITRKIAA
jgi:signal transduction histidine kinase